MFETLLSSLSALRPFAWRTALAFLILTSFLLFAPNAALNRLSLLDISKSAGFTIGILWLFSASIIVVELYDFASTKISIWMKKRVYRKNMTMFLSSLSGDEKKAIIRYTAEDVSTVHFSLSGGIANALEAKGILTRTSSIGVAGSGDMFPFTIQPLALEVLGKRPELLKPTDARLK